MTTIVTVVTSTDTTTCSSATAISTTIVTVPAELYININTANIDELILLSGIGEKRAEAIIAYRDENGGFNNIEEIMNVSGIGAKIFSDICDHIYVDEPVYTETESDDIYSEIPPDDDVQEVFSEAELTIDDVAPINLNEADMETLMYLPYVDEFIAGKIIELRDKIHVFSHVYELLYVQELSQDQVAEIIQFVYVDESS